MGFYDDALAPDVQRESPPLSAAPSGSGTYGDALLPPPVEAPQPQGNVVYRSSIFPLSRTDQGKVVFDWGSGLTGQIGKALTLPGRVASGEVQMPQLGSEDPHRYDQVIPESVNMAQTFGPTNPMIRSGDKMVPGTATNLERPIRPAPSVDELFKTGGRQMDQFERLPLNYNAGHIGDLADTIENRLIQKGIFRDDAKGIYNTLDSMREAARLQAAGNTVTINPASLHSLRQSIGNKFGVQGEHQLAPSIAQEELDRFIAAPPSGAAGGNPFAAALAPDLFQRARGNLAAGYRGEGLADLSRTIDLKTAAAHSGRNLDNTTRSQITQFLLDEKRTRGFTPTEEGMLESTVYGDPWTNRLRTTSKKLGGGGGLLSAQAGGVVGGAVGMAAGIPPYVGYPAGAAITPFIGKIAGDVAAARTLRGLSNVSEATRRRSPMFQEQPPLPPQAPAMASRDLITRALIGRALPVPPDVQTEDGRIVVQPSM